MADNRERPTNRKRSMTIVGIVVVVLIIAAFLMNYFGNYTTVSGG